MRTPDEQARPALLCRAGTAPAFTAAGENEPKPVVMLGLTVQPIAGLAHNAPKPMIGTAKRHLPLPRNKLLPDVAGTDQRLI
jgi:hypothetical protein